MLMILFAVLAGCNIVITRFFNAGSSQQNGLSMSTLMNYITGLFTSLLVLWFSGEKNTSTLTLPFHVNPLIYLGGTVGVITLLISNHITPRMPAFLLTLLIFLSQLLTALLLDFFFFGNFSAGKLFGGLLVLVGLWHYQFIHQRRSSQKNSTIKEK